MSIAIPADVRERVIQAAQELYEQNGRESMPTVDAVRRLARVDMNAASAVMREWRRAQTAQAAPVAVTVPEVVTQAHGAALVALWQTAQELANESLRVAQAAWEAERAEADHDRQELADAYERQAAELDVVRAAAEQSARLHQEQQDTQAQALAAVRAELVTAATRAERAEARAQEIELRAADLRGELDHAHQEQGRIRAELAAAIARAERAESQAQDAEQRAAALRGELESAHQESERNRAETATLAGELRQSQDAVAVLRAQLSSAEASKTQEIERERQEREQLLGELNAARAAVSQAEAVGAEARERAAVLAGKLESEQSHSAALAALLARLNLVAGSEGEGGEPSA
ncbi:DNA-binding protein [Aeromonas caviae]|uniref:DNA-binding protein n=1 Tax=Aeromonas caviae TaxID=648 RepID=UPI002B2458A6|nr:DNA-binding protein [Aeromonas caviae]MEA9433313.1 DNA-binding protein [Aeromonas caviae]